MPTRERRAKQLGVAVDDLPARGRPTKYNKAVHDTIIECLDDGVHIEVAAALAGIEYETVRRWIAEGKAGNPTYSEFYAAATRAELEVERKLVRSWVHAAKTDWRAASEWLARKAASRWHREQTINHTGDIKIGLYDARPRVAERLAEVLGESAAQALETSDDGDTETE